MARLIFVVILIVHGLIHLLGFLKAFELANISELTQSITRPLGILWLITAWWPMMLSAAFSQSTAVHSAKTLAMSTSTLPIRSSGSHVASVIRSFLCGRCPKS